MQIDMHYYGVYVLARAAGITENAAQVIATASQFVDDSVENIPECYFKDGSRLQQIVTAHHAGSVKNMSRDDQRKVWVPFHFLPGGETMGKNAEANDLQESRSTYEHRLLCKADSAIARQMLKNAIDNSDKQYGMELVGITSHVYADTFSHCGFSGISSKYNKIDNGSIKPVNLDEMPENIQKYLNKKMKKTIRRIIKDLVKVVSPAVEFLSDGLGHGAVFTFPDLPYLYWTFSFEKERTEYKTSYNGDRFIEACRKLYAFFKDYASNHSENTEIYDAAAAAKVRSFDDIENLVKNVISFPGDETARIIKWQYLYINDLKLGDRNKHIPAYDIKQWIGNLEKIRGTGNRDAVNRNLYGFYQAAEFHRTYILRDLLPSHGIYVI